MIKKILTKSNLLLFLILIFAIFIRVYKIADVPSGLHGDEASFGYNAYSILLTGKDEYGKFMPLVLKSFGDYAPALYVYITIPFVKIFGLSVFSVRIPTAIFGVIFILLGFLIVRKITGNKSVGLISALLLTISPISLLLSRVQSDPLVSIVFILLGFYFLLLWLDVKKKLYIFLYALFFILSFYTYFSPRIFVPLLISLIFIFYQKQLRIKKIFKVFLFVSLFILVMDGVSFLGKTDARINQLYIFNNAAVILPMEESIREEGQNSAILTRIIHNKITAHIDFAIKNYFSYFNYDFLFARGGQPDRERIPGVGLMYPIELPFLLFGIYMAFCKKEKWASFLFLWIITTPFILMFALDESPNVHRFFFTTLPIEFFISYGIYEFFRKIKKHKVISLFLITTLVLIFLYSFLYFLDALFNLQPVHQPWYRGFVYKDLVSSVVKIQGKYKKIVITKDVGAPYIYFLFYQKYDPSLYQKEGSPRDLDYSGFDKYYFVPEDCPLRIRKTKEDRGYPIEPNVLYINKATCPNNLINTKLIKTIYWNDNNAAVVLMEYTGKNPSQDLMPIGSSQGQ